MTNRQGENNQNAPSDNNDQRPYEVYHIPTTHPYYEETQHDEYGPNSNEPVYMAIMRHPQQPTKINKPWWLWAIGILDVVVVLVVVITVDLIGAEENELANAPRSDQEARIFIFFIRLLSLLIQFLMGVTIMCGLCSSMESTTVLCLHGWLYGAYFLICKKCFMFVYDIIQYTSDSGIKAPNLLGAIIGIFIGIVYRLITVILVRRFMRNLPQSVARE